MNIPVFLLLYYALFYSIGVASLIFALILRCARNEALLGRFIACTAAMTAIVVVSTALNATGDSGGGPLRPFLHWLNLTLAAAFSYLIIAFATEAFPFRGDHWIKRLALILCAACLILCGIGVLRGPAVWIDVAILTVKTLAVYGAAAMALVPRRGGSEPIPRGPYQLFLRIASLTVAILGPLIIWEEIGGRLGAFPFKFQGSLSLPLFYGIWSACFIAAQVRYRLGPTRAGAETDPEFIARYGITRREAEVLARLVAGESYKSIMSALSISMPTVKSHVASLYRKTNTANRLVLARKIAAEASVDRVSHTKG